jgi:hypothetical protein
LGILVISIWVGLFVAPAAAQMAGAPLMEKPAGPEAKKEEPPPPAAP